MHEDKKEIYNAAQREILAMMGLVAGNWAVLESHMEECLIKIIGADRDMGPAVTTYLGSRNVTAAFKVICSDTFSEEDIKENFTPLFNKIDSLRTERNAIVHTKWEEVDLNEGNPKVKTFVVEPRKSLKLIPRERTRDEIYQKSQEIAKAHEDFLFLMLRKFSVKPDR